MPSSAAPPRSPLEAPPPTLATKAFPRRVRRLLEGVLEYTSDELERTLSGTLNDFEQQLFKLAEQARNNELQARCFEALRAVKRGRADLTPRFMIGLEAALASIREPGSLDFSRAAPRGAGHGMPSAGIELALVDEIEVDEATAIKEAVSRIEIRNSLPLYLLGQRFGVLAGRPAFDPEHLPVGPMALCRILQRAADCLDLGAENRILLMRQFERQLVPVFAGFIESLNAFLIREGVLPTLTYVPVRPRARAAADAGGNAATARGGAGAGSGRGGAGGSGARAGGGTMASAGRMARAGAIDAGGTNGADGQDAQAEEMFGVLRQLLSGRRQLMGKFAQDGASVDPAKVAIAAPQDVQSVLGALQQRPTAPVMVDGKPAPRTVSHIKQDLLAQLRQVTPEGKVPALSAEDTDTVDLVGMLFDHLLKDVKPNSPAAGLLAKLQVPLLRVALSDKAFFTRQQHPARQMLNTIAETGAFWLGDDEGDRGTIEKMRMLVDRVTGEFDGDLTLFDALLGDLSGHMQTLVRKAEVAERRHVEAARGKEKLALARQHSGEEMAQRLKGKRVPRFVNTLLTQAWTDVLALTSLRHGEESETFRQQLGIADRLIEASTAKPGSEAALKPEEAKRLKQDVEAALTQVGYHAEDADAISSRLVGAEESTADDDAASRTELTLRLKAKTRLGEDQATEAAAERKPQATMTPKEKTCLEQVRQLPFGAWIDFVTNQQGEVVRRRLSWFSTVTGHALFVNHRGQRVGEYTLDWLARALAAGQIRIVQTEKGSLIDRAWNSIVNALKSFAGGKEQATGGEGQA